MIVDFYHLTASPLERVLPSIAEKVLAGGERLLIVAEPDRLAGLDETLWSFARDSFLPHGRERPESQPILLSDSPGPANGAANIALADGRWREEALGFARTFYFFDNDGRDAAREAWRALKARPEVEARYWKQDERGKWVQGP
ncbi:MAG TPA: DNA polymerase III subunit chi [Allosphingosinicella sp.]|nr:DNA polymerase III subunit chi [Allosphingosinicella sp.]